MTPFDHPRLIADIGGTYARFAVETALGRFEHAASLRCADHADFHAAVTAYLGGLPKLALQHAAIAIANPVEGDMVRMTNYHWQFSIEQMRERLGLDTLVVVNDFTALAMALPKLTADQRRQVGAGTPREPSVIGVLGSGSGLGVSGLIPAGDGWIALGTEGGHTSFSPRDEREIAIRPEHGALPTVENSDLWRGAGQHVPHCAVHRNRMQEDWPIEAAQQGHHRRDSRIGAKMR